MKTMKAIVSVMGEYEKQQSVNLMYISMKRMCIHVSLVFLMFSIFTNNQICIIELTTYSIKVS